MDYEKLTRVLKNPGEFSSLLVCNFIFSFKLTFNDYKNNAHYRGFLNHKK